MTKNRKKKSLYQRLIKEKKKKSKRSSIYNPSKDTDRVVDEALKPFNPNKNKVNILNR